MVSLRHARYGHFSRQRHARRLLSFLATQATRLLASATAQTIVPVAIANANAAQTLTSAGQPADTQTVTIGAKVYTFQTTLTNVDGHVHIGASAAASLTNLFHAINASGGTVGTDYATLTTASPDVTATNPTGTTLVATSKLAGSPGNATPVASTVTGGTWGDTHLAGGVDATFGPTVTATAHGISLGEGPYVITSSNGAAHVPAGYAPGDFLYVLPVSANVIKLYRDPILSELQTFTGAGTGTISLAKASTQASIYDVLKRNPAAQVQAAADIDNLR